MCWRAGRQYTIVYITSTRTRTRTGTRTWNRTHTWTRAHTRSQAHGTAGGIRWAAHNAASDLTRNCTLCQSHRCGPVRHGKGYGHGNGYTRFMVSASSARHVKNACKATALATLISLSYGWPVCLGRNCVVELGESLPRIASGLLHNLGSTSSDDGPPFLG